MKYGDYIEREAEDQRREELQERKDRYGDPPTYPTREGHFVERVDVVKAMRIALTSMVLCTTVCAASPTPQEQLTRAQFLMSTAMDPGDLKAATWHMERAQAACVLEAKTQITKKSKLYKKYRARYLRYVRANQQRINRLNRQARGLANTWKSIGNQFNIQARSNAHFRHDTTPHGHPHH